MTAFIRFSNRFTTTFKCKHPIVLAPMGGISGSQLAGAVSAAGGIGFLGTGGQNRHTKLHYVGVGEIVSKLREAQKVANASTVGVGLTIEGFLDKDAPVLDQLLSTNPHNLWLSTDGAGVVNFGPFCRLATSSRIPVNLFVQVSNSEQALVAAMTGAHAIVVQGKGSGGYAFPDPNKKEESTLPERKNIENEEQLLGEVPHRKRYHLSTLIPECVEAINALNMESPPLIIAAGGITTGADISECLNLGADAVCIGTLFAVAAESDLTTEEKLKFARGGSLPKGPEAEEAHLRVNPDGSKVHLGESNSFASSLMGGRKNVLHDCVNMPAREIVDELMDDFYKFRTSNGINKESERLMY